MLDNNILQILYVRSALNITRCVRKDGSTVVIKRLSNEANHQARNRFLHEYDLLRKIDLPNVIKTYGFEKTDAGLAMALEDIGGESLDNLEAGTKLGLDEFFKLAIDLVVTLAGLHRLQIMHKAISPAHIVVNAATGDFRLIGFTQADEFSSFPKSWVEGGESVTPELERRLSYISPEQTGRMNRAVDYRTDFYSLGVTFYQLLTGKLPYTADDALGVIHNHIAVIPMAPHILEPAVPQTISHIILKLMAKMPEDRYQTAWGLFADLGRCWKELQELGAISEFIPGEYDISDQLRFPERLYGREIEIARLSQAFGRVCDGGSELLLVNGYAGVGKTVLIHELFKPVTEAKGYFIEGKFDQLQRNTPYSAWIQAFQELVSYLLMSSESEMEQLRRRIQAAVGNIGRVLTDVIPNLELIIGPQAVVPELRGIEAQNRFNYVFLEFVKAIIANKQPLIVFLDDLQWIDTASLRLLNTLITGRDVSYVMVIGAYRDNEVDALHPLAKCIEALYKEDASIERFTLSELTEKTVNELIADLLRRKNDETASITHLIYSKTGGNPFFLLQTIKTLVENQVISFDAVDHTWQWEASAIEKINITDNIVTLMVSKIQQLPPETQNLLIFAACLGYKFSLSNLHVIGIEFKGNLYDLMQPAIYEGLLVNRGELCQFVHDRVQQAAYTLIPVEERPVRHLHIGRLLLDNTPEDKLIDNIFEIVDHLNRGIDLITEPFERKRLAELNLIAGRQAKASAAFALAMNYLTFGTTALEPNGWEDSYELDFSLHTMLAECEYLVGSFDHSEYLLNEALDHADSLLDRATIYRMFQRLYQLSGRWREAVSAALKGLALFGLSFPETDEEIRLATEAEKKLIDTNLNGRQIANLVDISFTDDTETKVFIGLIAESITQFFITRPVLWHLVVLKCVNLCLEKGYVEETPYIFGSYCKMLVALYNDISSAFEFSQMSLKLNERLPQGGSLKGLPPFYHASVIGFWRQHFEANLPLFDQAFQAFIDSGDINWGSYLTYNSIWLHWENGESLEQVLELVRRYTAFNQRVHNDIVYNVDRVLEQFILSLQGKTLSLTDFNDASFNETACITAIEQASFGIGIGYYRIVKQIAAFIAGKFDEALEWAGKVTPVLNSVSSMAIWSDHYFYNALIITALYDQTGEVQRTEFLVQLNDILGKLKFWANNCPANFANRVALVSAEAARIEGRMLEAEHLYEEAIASAKNYGFIQNEAVACEVAAAFYRMRGFDRIAQTYLSDALHCYNRWGAFGKCSQLQKQHPWLAQTRQTDTLTLTSHLDAISLAKAQQAISGEIIINHLPQTLLRIVMANAGAQYGYLSVEGVGDIQAEMRIDSDGAPQIVVGSIPAGADLPISILNYVKRSQEMVILPDTRSSISTASPSLQGNDRGDVYSINFQTDEYIQRTMPKSVLCMPIHRNEMLLGVLYLENKLISETFTPERRIVLEMLASQAAISLETASVYKALKESEIKYRQIVDTASEGILLVGSDGRTIQFVNDRMAIMLGYTQEEMLNLSLDSFLPAADMTDHMNKIESRRLGLSEQYQRRLLRKDGQIIWTLASATPIFDENRNFAGSFAMLTDITDLKEAEEELLLNAERTDALLQLNQMTGATLDEITSYAFEAGIRLTRSKLGYLGFMNDDETVMSIQLWSREAMAECSVSNRPILYPVETTGLWGEAIRQRRPIITNDYSAYNPWKKGTPEGHVRLVRHMNLPVIVGGKIVLIAGVGNKSDDYNDDDINQLMLLMEGMWRLIERKKAQEDLINMNEELEQRVRDRTLRLEAANNELEAFAYTVSHDLRAPLRHIDGFIDLLAKETSEVLNEKSLRYMNRITSSSKRMGMLIDDLLSFSRMGRQEMSQQDVPLNPLVNDVIYELTLDIQGRTINWHIDELPKVVGDASLLRVVLVNLIANAIKFTQPKDPSEIEIGKQISSQEIIIYIKDNGVGFDQQYADRLFGVFQRLHRMDEFEGTGIGLANVKRIIERHGGRVWVEGKLGEGATFYFTLPKS